MCIKILKCMYHCILVLQHKSDSEVRENLLFVLMNITHLLFCWHEIYGCNSVMEIKTLFWNPYLVRTHGNLYVVINDTTALHGRCTVSNKEIYHISHVLEMVRNIFSGLLNEAWYESSFASVYCPPRNPISDMRYISQGKIKKERVK